MLSSIDWHSGLSNLVRYIFVMSYIYTHARASSQLGNLSPICLLLGFYFLFVCFYVIMYVLADMWSEVDKRNWSVSPARPNYFYQTAEFGRWTLYSWSDQCWACLRVLTFPHPPHGPYVVMAEWLQPGCLQQVASMSGPLPWMFPCQNTEHSNL